MCNPTLENEYNQYSLLSSFPFPKRQISFTLYGKVFNLIQSRGTLDTPNYFYACDDSEPLMKVLRVTESPQAYLMERGKSVS